MGGLRDIKGLMSIDDYSLYLLMSIIIASLALLYLLFKKIGNRTDTAIKIAKKELKNLDLSDSKIASYKLTKYGKVLSNEEFEYLQKYKYRREVVDFSSEDIVKIKGFLDGI